MVAKYFKEGTIFTNKQTSELVTVVSENGEKYFKCECGDVHCYLDEDLYYVSYRA